MALIKHQDDPDVTALIDKAARLACESLDASFPGFDSGGISSQFNGMLAAHLTAMLKGHAHQDLNKLLIDDSFFGNPLSKGELFLVTKRDSSGLVVLVAKNGRFLPIDLVDDAFTSYGAAATMALEFCREEGFSIEQAQSLGLEIKAVQPCANKEIGYIVL